MTTSIRHRALAPACCALLGLVLAGRAGAQVADSASAIAPAVAAAPALVPAPPRIGGYLQAREFASDRAGLSAVLNRVRMSADGTLPQRFSYRALVEYEASAGVRAPATVSLREAIVRWSPAPFTLTAGEFKTPFTREYLIAVPALELADLATVIDSLAPKYDVGVMGEVAAGAWGTLAIGAFNGEGANSISNRDTTAMVVARATARPIPQLGLGASGARNGPDTLRWGADANVSQWGVTVRSEYVTRMIRNRPRGKDEFGWYVFESVRVVPRVQVLARQEDFQRPAVGTSRRVRGLAYGVNFDVVPARVRLLGEVSRRIAGVRQAATDTFLAQVQAQF